MLHVATRTRARPLLNTLLLLLLTTTLQPTMAQSIALLPTTLNPLGAASSIIIYATTVLPQVTVVQTLAPAPVPAPAVTTTVVQVLPAPVVPVTVTTTAYLTSAYCLTTLPNWYPAQTAVCPAGAPVGCVGSGGSAMNGFCCAQGMYCQAYAAGGKVRRGEAEGEEEDVLETDWDGEGDGEGVVERGVVAGVAGVGCCPYGKVCNGVLAQGAVYTSTVYVQTSVPQAVAYTTVYVAGAGVAAATTNNILNGVYCSTLTGKGANLPTTRQGTCGTILVVNGGASNIPGRLLLVLQGMALLLLACCLAL